MDQDSDRDAARKRVGHAIREIRGATGQKQAAFGERVGVLQEQVCYWESGARIPDGPAVGRLCKLTDAKRRNALLEALAAL